MTNKTYDVLKFIAQILLPAFGALYFGLAEIWNLPYGEQVVGTITIVDTFLGALLGVSSNTYYKTGKDLSGTVAYDEETGIAQMELYEGAHLSEMKTVTLKVDDPT